MPIFFFPLLQQTLQTGLVGGRENDLSYLTVQDKQTTLGMAYTNLGRDTLWLYGGIVKFINRTVNKTLQGHIPEHVFSFVSKVCFVLAHCFTHPLKQKSLQAHSDCKTKPSEGSHAFTSHFVLHLTTKI